MIMSCKNASDKKEREKACFSSPVRKKILPSRTLYKVGLNQILFLSQFVRILSDMILPFKKHSALFPSEKRPLFWKK